MNKEVKIKICGITTLKEIAYLNELKPDYIGFIFTKSKRKISIEEGIKLSSATSPSIKKVAVFRNNTIDEIKSVIKSVPIDVIQLHGNEDNRFINELYSLVGKDIEVWKAIAIKDHMNDDINFISNKILLDSGNPGNGESFNWNNFNYKNINKEFFLAGGINLDNVIEGIEKFSPFGVDVSTGVESITSNGEREKSYKKLKRFIEKVRLYNEKQI